MKTFDHYRRQTARIIEGMLPDGKLGLNPLADPQRHDDTAYGSDGREYRTKALRALSLVQIASSAPDQWREVADLLHQCVNHAINAHRSAADDERKAICLAAEGAAAAAGIAARYALAWLEGFHAHHRPDGAKTQPAFEYHRQQAENAVKKMFQDEAGDPNPLVNPEYHKGQSAFAIDGREYRTRAVQAMTIMKSAASGPRQWREAVNLLRECGGYALNQTYNAPTEAYMAAARAAKNHADAAHQAAAQALEWLEEFEPERPDPLEKRLLIWFNSGNTGLSAETIAFATIGLEPRPHRHPHNRHGFSLCLMLRQLIPETEAGLDRLSRKCAHCRAIRDNWQRLETATHQDAINDSRLTTQTLQEIAAQHGDREEE